MSELILVTHTDAGHVCPRCSNEVSCPCDTCVAKREDKTKTWAFYDYVNLMCLVCGFRAHHYWWLDYEHQVAYPEKNAAPNLAQEIEEISAKYTDFRELTWHPYIITRDHGDDASKVYLAGTPCIAARDEKAELLYFKFEDGGFSELEGHKYYLKGIEFREPLEVVIMNLAVQVAHQEMTREEDERSFQAIKDAIDNDRP